MARKKLPRFDDKKDSDADDAETASKKIEVDDEPWEDESWETEPASKTVPRSFRFDENEEMKGSNPIPFKSENP